MQDDGGLILGVMILAVFLAFGYGIVYGIHELFWPKAPPTAQEVWARSMEEKCFSQGGRLWVSPDGRRAECTRSPFMRMPKQLFVEKFQ